LLHAGNPRILEVILMLQSQTVDEICAEYINGLMEEEMIGGRK
jgi:hypothetical protein